MGRWLSTQYRALGLLLLAVCLVYSNSLNGSFHFDDSHAVTDNPAIRSLANLPRILTDTTAFSVLPANQTYRPVVTASLALDYALAHGYEPFWFHLSTLLWFLLLIVLLFFWAEALFDRTAADPRNRWLALGVAAWFGLHPAMAETINYVIQRGDLYCTLGCVAGLVLYARFPVGRRWGMYLLPFVLAMLSKPPAAVFPLLLLGFLLLFPLREANAPQQWRAALLACLPALAVTALLLGLQADMTPKSYTPSTLSGLAYRVTQPYVWLRYTATLFLPLHLNVDTDLQPLAPWSGRAVAGYGFLALLLVGVVLTARKPRLRPIAYGLLWFLLTQLPTSLYPLSEVENDHRMFFSFPGLMLAVVWAVGLGLHRVEVVLGPSRRPLQRALPQVAGLAALLLLCGYAYGVRRRNMVWHDEASLWADDVLKSPGNGRGLMNYGLTRMNAGDLQGAQATFQRAHTLLPNYPVLEVNLGVVEGRLADAGQGSATAETAEAHFLRAMALAPGSDLPHAYYGRWLLQHGRRPEAIAQLQTAGQRNGVALMQRDLLLTALAQGGEAEAARELARQTLALAPGDPIATAVLDGQLARTGQGSNAAAIALVNASLREYRAGHFAQSLAIAQQAVKADPRSAAAWNNVGAGYGALHQWTQGIDAEQRALALDPALTIAGNNLRWFQAEQARSERRSGDNLADAAASAATYVNLSLTLNQAGRYAESIAAAQKATELEPGLPEAWNNIAAGAEALGDWDRAIAAARHALALRPDFPLAQNNLAWSLAQKARASR